MQLLSSVMEMTSKKIFGLFFVGALLAGCQTTKKEAFHPDEFVGNGPITIMAATQRRFATYRSKGNPAYFAVSMDGVKSGWSYCKRSPKECASGTKEKLIALKYCEKYAYEKCKVFANGREIVWQGAVTYWERSLGANK